MIKWPTLKSLHGIEIVVSPQVPDDKLVLVGEEKYKDPFHFSRQLSIMDLNTGKVSGSVHEGEVQAIHVSEKNKDMFNQSVLDNSNNSNKEIL